MGKGILFAVVLGLVVSGAGIASARPTSAQGAQAAAPAAELKVGLGVEKMKITGEAADFRIAAGTKVFAWTRVSGCADSKITIAFSKGDQVVSRQELDVPHSPYRTHAYRTFRAGDEGEWTAKVLTADGAEIGSVSFKVEVEP